MQVDPDPADRPLTPNPAHTLKSEYFGSLGIGGKGGGLNPLCPLVLRGQISYMKFVECGVFLQKKSKNYFSVGPFSAQLSGLRNAFLSSVVTCQMSVVALVGSTGQWLVEDGHPLSRVFFLKLCVSPEVPVCSGVSSLVPSVCLASRLGGGTAGLGMDGEWFHCPQGLTVCSPVSRCFASHVLSTLACVVGRM